MEKRTLGIILSLLGIVALIIAGINFIEGAATNSGAKEIITYTIIGFIFYFSGVGLLRTIEDKPV